MKPHEIPLKSHFFLPRHFPPALWLSRPLSHGQGIFKKFARLASLAAGRNEATAEELAGEGSGFRVYGEEQKVVSAIHQYI